MQMSRRFFLGGAISLVAATTFVPSPNAMNMPRIYSHPDKRDTAGLNALFANEPVIFNKDNIGIDGHYGVIIHKGNYYFDNPVFISNKLTLEIKEAWFYGSDLADELPFFNIEPKKEPSEKGTVFDSNIGSPVKFLTKSTHFGKFYREYDSDRYGYREKLFKSREEMEFHERNCVCENGQLRQLM